MKYFVFLITSLVAILITIIIATSMPAYARYHTSERTYHRHSSFVYYPRSSVPFGEYRINSQVRRVRIYR